MILIFQALIDRVRARGDGKDCSVEKRSEMDVSVIKGIMVGRIANIVDPGWVTRDRHVWSLDTMTLALSDDGWIHVGRYTRSRQSVPPIFGGGGVTWETTREDTREQRYQAALGGSDIVWG